MNTYPDLPLGCGLSYLFRIISKPIIQYKHDLVSMVIFMFCLLMLSKEPVLIFISPTMASVCDVSLERKFL